MAYFPIIPVPLLANLTNGNNYLPPISTSQANLLAHLHQSAAVVSHAENGLDFNRSAVASKLCQLAGAGPMELESLNEERNSYVTNATSAAEMNLANAAANMRKLGKDLRADNEHLEKNFASLNPIYNAMGISSQNFLMMPGVMNMLRDTSMVPTLQPYAVLNHQLSAHSPSKMSSDIETSPTTSTNSSASNAKETITCNSCILLPPNPGAPAPTTRERPNGDGSFDFLLISTDYLYMCV